MLVDEYNAGIPLVSVYTDDLVNLKLVLSLLLDTPKTRVKQVSWEGHKLYAINRPTNTFV